MTDMSHEKGDYSMIEELRKFQDLEGQRSGENGWIFIYHQYWDFFSSAQMLVVWLKVAE